MSVHFRDYFQEPYKKSFASTPIKQKGRSITSVLNRRDEEENLRLVL